MIRTLIFILWVILLAGVVTYFAGMQGRIEAEAFGLKYDMHAGAAITAAFVLLGLVIFFTSWFKDLAALPGKMKAREREAKRARGIAALTRGLEAVAVGDASDAQHHARVARRNLEDVALTRLLTVQAAELAGDDKAAGENFTAMLEAPETEFLGLRGLYLKAKREGDTAAAQGYADRAFRLRPNALWAFQSVFDLGLDRGAWGETRAALTTAVKNKIVDPTGARRAEAALLTADAYAAALTGDNSLALQEAEAALKLQPGFAPAAALAAERHQEGGKKARAAKILQTAFAAAPHPALIHRHNALYAESSETERAEQMKKIADRNPTSREAKLAFARRHILLKEYADAITILEPMLMEKATAKETAAMADAVAGAHGDEAAKVWLAQAAEAPRDPTPGADGAFHFTREGWARLVREYMDHDRLAPPPLEDDPRGLSLDEIKLLAPPPKAIKTEEPIDTAIEENAEGTAPQSSSVKTAVTPDNEPSPAKDYAAKDSNPDKDQKPNTGKADDDGPKTDTPSQDPVAEDKKQQEIADAARSVS